MLGVGVVEYGMLGERVGENSILSVGGRKYCTLGVSVWEYPYWVLEQGNMSC